MRAHDAKSTLYEQFARVAKAVSHPKRLEILDVLQQGERSVEAVAAESGLAMTTASAHLQIMRRVGLVAVRKDGTRVFYRVADDTVQQLVRSLQAFARARLAEVEQTVRTYFVARDEFDPIDRDELMRRMQDGDVVVIDVRPAVEFSAGHIAGARSVPFEELESRLQELPPDAEIIAYCRGPYCVLAPESVALLRRHGRRARRMEEGFPEWRAAGLPVGAAGR